MTGGRRQKKRSEVRENIKNVKQDIDPLKVTIDHIADFMYSGN